MISYDEMKLDESIYREQSFSSICQTMREKYCVDIIIPHLPHEQTIIKFYGYCKHISEVVMRLNGFIQNEFYPKQRIELNKGQLKFLFNHIPHWKKLLKQYHPGSKCDGVTIHLPKEGDSFGRLAIILEGHKSKTSPIYQQITMLIESICSNDAPIIIDQPGVFPVLNASETQQRIEAMEYSVPCVIDCRFLHPMTKCQGFTKEGKVISLNSGNIEQSWEELVVNMVDISLLSSGFEFSIRSRGGPKIQEDLLNYVQTHGKLLLPGDVVIRDQVEKLTFRKLIHAVVPNWASDTIHERKLFKDICLKILDFAQHYNSIAFSTCYTMNNLYKFPFDAYASTMIQAICEWSEKFPYSTLQKITILEHDPNTQHVAAAFADAMKSNLNVLPQYRTSSSYKRMETTIYARTKDDVEKAKKLFLDIIDYNCALLPLTTLREAILLQQKVKWQYLKDDGECIDYSAELSYSIEQAYQLYKRWKEKSTFCYKHNAVVYTIFFEKDPMQEMCNNGVLKRVQRIDVEGEFCTNYLSTHVCSTLSIQLKVVSS